jgi:hypothetical protein
MQDSQHSYRKEAIAMQLSQLSYSKAAISTQKSQSSNPIAEYQSRYRNAAIATQQ